MTVAELEEFTVAVVPIMATSDDPEVENGGWVE